ncbi:SH3 domain-binding glutamic acid-rich protein like [Argiope bruennichi]|uniref:SH3 domain-binding glutamic acid-rich protein like n=1 Tax=Argiope bruennichi TaxID=94029 RepID=A0A8T0EKL9_ARGBR|nr:SH3 domain-binding glutamic acid-rich protein like [Argiope bruennichi]
MTIKVYISGICGSQEIRKQQQRVIFILQGLQVDLQIIDVTDPGRDEDLVFMQEEAKKHGKKTQLPPQIFNENEYCGDYADFEMANDDDEIMKFLKLETGPSKAETLKSAEPSGDVITLNGVDNHEANEETPTTLEEPVSNGINHADNEIKEQETELVNNEVDVEETTVNDSPVAEEPEVTVEETKETEAVNEAKNEDEAKESSEEESEEESE